MTQLQQSVAGAPQQETPAIEVHGLYYAYKSRPALSGVSFLVRPQAIHGFVGPNGAGKTTTLKVLSTLLRPMMGTARVFGYDVVRHYQQVRSRIGFMPDYFGMYRQMTVYEYLDFFGAAYGLTLTERERTITDVLALTDMEGRKDDFIKGLSRGMQQRVSLARLLVHDPAVLFLDEPASGLDPRARIELMEILRELRRMGKTIFISSHILSELGTLCDHVTIIDRGRVRYTGSMEQLLNQEGETLRYVLKVKATSPAIEEALRSTTGMLDVAAVPEEAYYRLTFDTGAVDLNHVLQAAIAAGADIVFVRLEGRQLDEAFMDLTQPGVPT